MSRYNYNTSRTALFSLTLLLALHTAQAQTKIGGTPGPGNASAVLELESTAQGFLHPRMTTVQRDNISTPATGLTIYNTTTNCLQVYKGAGNGGWYDFCSTSGAFSFTNCSTPVITGAIDAQTPTTATIQLNYTNSTGQSFGTFAAGTVNSITASAPGGGMTALVAGTGSITLTLSGTPATAGAMQLPVSIAGAVCNVPITVGAFQGNVPVACGTPPGCTGGVANPANAVAGDKICWGGFEYIVVAAASGGKLWFDRNLGAKSVPTTATDVAGWGDYYQWGRRGDGHQCTINSNGGSANGGTNGNSATTPTQSTTPVVPHGNFITTANWLNPSNDNLWDNSATGGINNPCPAGWRVPSSQEMTNAIQPHQTDPFNNTNLKLPRTTHRPNAGNIAGLDGACRMWSSTAIAAGNNAADITFNPSTPSFAAGSTPRSVGFVIRCIKH